MWFFLASKKEIATTRASFPGGSWNSGIIANRRTCDNKMSVLAEFPAVSKTLDSSSKFGKKIL
jgi:hypothetical protein